MQMDLLPSSVAVSRELVLYVIFNVHILNKVLKVVAIPQCLPSRDVGWLDRCMLRKYCLSINFMALKT